MSVQFRTCVQFQLVNRTGTEIVIPYIQKVMKMQVNEGPNLDSSRFYPIYAQAPPRPALYKIIQFPKLDAIKKVTNLDSIIQLQILYEAMGWTTLDINYYSNYVILK